MANYPPTRAERMEDTVKYMATTTTQVFERIDTIPIAQNAPPLQQALDKGAAPPNRIAIRGPLAQRQQNSTSAKDSNHAISQHTNRSVFDRLGEVTKDEVESPGAECVTNV